MRCQDTRRRGRRLRHAHRRRTSQERNHPAADTAPSWSRDGRFLYFHSDRSGKSQVWKMRADGGEARAVTRERGYAAFESVDGRALFHSKSDGQSSLWTAGTDGGGARMPVPTLYRHNLTPGRSGIYLSTQRGLGGGPEILFYSFGDRTTKTVLRLPQPVGLGISVAPDESWLLFSQNDGSGADLMMVEGFLTARSGPPPERAAGQPSARAPVRP